MIDRFEQFSSSIAAIYKCIQKIERDQMARYGLKGPHVQCLVIMSRFPEGVTAAERCELCEKDKAAISRAVSELEKEGMLYRSGEKERVYRAPLLLTEKGKAIADQIRRITELAVRIAGTGLTAENREIFYSVLDLIASNLQMICEEGLEGLG